MPRVPRAPAIKADHVFRSPSLRHFALEVCGSPLFVVNKSAKFQYGMLKSLNKDDLSVDVLRKLSVYRQESFNQVNYVSFIVTIQLLNFNLTLQCMAKSIESGWMWSFFPLPHLGPQNT